MLSFKPNQRSGSNSVGFLPPVTVWIQAWKDAFAEKGVKLEYLITLAALPVALHFHAQYLLYIENRPGALVTDPLFEWFQPIDLTWTTFTIIYVCLFLAVVRLSYMPRRFCMAFQSYMVFLIFRTSMMFVLPLEAPAKMIILEDPLVEFLGTGRTLTKDLFFSGHTSTMFLMTLTAVSRKWQIGFLLGTLIVAVCLILQQVHYTVDVLVAPFVTYGCYRIVRKLHPRWDAEWDRKTLQ
jgi:hypothetical protein